MVQLSFIHSGILIVVLDFLFKKIILFFCPFVFLCRAYRLKKHFFILPFKLWEKNLFSQFSSDYFSFFACQFIDDRKRRSVDDLIKSKRHRHTIFFIDKIQFLYLSVCTLCVCVCENFVHFWTKTKQKKMARKNFLPIWWWWTMIISLACLLSLLKMKRKKEKKRKFHEMVLVKVENDDE